MKSQEVLKRQKEFRQEVYECLFYHKMKWPVETQNIYFNGTLVHYSDFMKAKRGTL